MEDHRKDHRNDDADLPSAPVFLLAQHKQSRTPAGTTGVQ